MHTNFKRRILMEYSNKIQVNKSGEELRSLDWLIMKAEIIKDEQISPKPTSSSGEDSLVKEESDTKPLGTREEWSKNVQRKKYRER